MTELGARRVRVVPPSEVEPDWEGAGRRLARVGAGRKPKIHQLASLGGAAAQAVLQAIAELLPPDGRHQATGGGYQAV